MIRDATPADFDRLIALGRAMHAEGWYSYLPFGDAKVRRTLEMLTTFDHGYARVSERDGQIVGVLLAAISPLWFCDELCAADLALYVAPAHRGRSVAARLVADFVAWADARGVAEKNISTSCGIAIEGAGRLLQHMRFTHVGGVYKQRGAACAKA